MRQGGLRTEVEGVVLARILSLGFSPPDQETLAELETLAAALLEHGGGGADAELAEVLAADRDVEERRREYEELFGGEVRCPPYEGSYEADPFRHARQLADVAGFYRAFGAAAAGPAAERPDHAGCELEFLSFLGAKRLTALEEGRAGEAETCRAAEDAFLRDHLGRWLPAFCRRVLEAGPSELYSALARLGERFVLDELEARGLEVRPLRRRGRLAVEADCFECGAGLASR